MQKSIRNIAIIAHVDHGKTTLVDQLMKYCQIFRSNQEVENCFLDSNDQERERGITILSKNISLSYKNTKINLIDTPGHADFAGEVERVLSMADGCLLLIDSHDGVMPQTRFVLKKALLENLKPIIVINKMDRSDKRPKEALDTVYDLFMELDVNNEELDFPILYSSGRGGWASLEEVESGENLEPLMESILNHIPEPKVNLGSTQIQFTSFEFSDYVGRIGIGRLNRGPLNKKDPCVLIKNDDGTSSPAKIKALYVFEGLGKKEVEEVQPGDLCAIVGLDNLGIGDTLADANDPIAMPSIKVEEPTMSMSFFVNDSPFFGKEGKYVTSRHIHDYLAKAKEQDLSLHVQNNENSFTVFGRGILHLSVLVENMRREKYELAVGQPQVIYKTIDGSIHEPFEELIIEVNKKHAGKVIEEISLRKGMLKNIEYTNESQIQNFEIPSRGIIGLRSFLLNTCSGNIIMTHSFLDYRPKEAKIPTRLNGVIISMDQGQVVPYAVANLQERGTFFVSPGDVTYVGQIVGENAKAGDIEVNIQKEKKLSNMRASGSDKSLKFAPAKILTLEESLEFIQEDEIVEVTPKSIRLRKKILDAGKRKRSENKI